MKIKTVNLLNIDQKILKVSEFDKMLNEVGYEDNKKPLYAFLYLDNKYGVTLRILGSIEEFDVEKYLKSDKKIKNYDKINKIEYQKLSDELCSNIDEIIDYFSNGGLERLKKSNIIEKVKNETKPEYLDVTAIYDDGCTEKLFAFGCDYLKQKDEVIVKLFSDSFYDDNLKIGTTLLTKYIKNSSFEGLLIKRILKESDKID